MIILKKLGSWLKSYWYIPALVAVGVVAFIVWRRIPTSLIEVFEKRREMHQREVEAIENIHAEEIAKREKALAAYHKTIKAIEEKYEEANSQLNKRKKNQIKKIVEETHDNPDLLAKKLADQMGFQIVYPENEELGQ